MEKRRNRLEYLIVRSGDDYRTSIVGTALKAADDDICLLKATKLTIHKTQTLADNMMKLVDDVEKLYSPAAEVCTFC